jgi:hypothetical protein
VGHIDMMLTPLARRRLMVIGCDSKRQANLKCGVELGEGDGKLAVIRAPE